MVRSSSLILCALAAGLVAGGVVGCDKGGPAAVQGSGALAAADQALFKLLPRNANAVFGGNYVKMQDFMSTKLGQVSAQMTDKMMPGMSKWSTCLYSGHEMRFAGAATYEDGALGMDIVMAGMTVPEVKACADQAGFTATISDDAKLLTVNLPPPSGEQGYLLVADKTLYTRQTMRIGVAPKGVGAAREDMEARVAAAAKDNVMTDPALQAIIAKTDRTKTMWFAGTAARTPLEGKVGELFGSVDVGSGLAIDLSVQVTDGGLRDKMDDGVKQMKQAADQLPGAIKDLVKGVDYHRDGDRARFVMKMTDAQIGALSSMIPGLPH